jgi:hypothetical protein
VKTRQEAYVYVYDGISASLHGTADQGHQPSGAWDAHGVDVVLEFIELKIISILGLRVG